MAILILNPNSVTTSNLLPEVQKSPFEIENLYLHNSIRKLPSVSL